MHFLHSRRIVHMDLKSPNILLGETGVAKIADVGLARVMGSESIVHQVVSHHPGRLKISNRKDFLVYSSYLCVRML